MPFIAAAPALWGGIFAGSGAAAAAGISARSNNSIANQQQTLAQQQLARSQPAYNSAYNYYQSLMSGNNQSIMQAVAPSLNQSNLQFNQAKQNALQGAFGRGGGLTAAMTNVEGMRALSNSNIIGNAVSGAPAALGALASGDQNGALSALSGAQNSNVGNSMLQAQAMTGIGSFLTRLLSNPNMFSNNNSNYFQNPTVNQSQLPSSVYNPSMFFNPSAVSPYFPGMAENYFPNA